MKYLTIEQRERLQKDLRDLAARLRSEIAEHRQLANHGEETDDDAVADLEGDLDIADLARDAKELEDVEAALKRIHEPHVVSPYLGSTGIDLAKLPGFGHAVKKSARGPLEAARAEARRHDVNAEAVSVVGGEPWKAILRAAQARRCDLIVMASHGRRGLSGVILGSEAAKVLARSTIPVLVCR
jgi:nucleotide-binding universal stress UspA family protein